MPLDNADVDKILNRMAVRLAKDDDPLAVAMKAIAWQYTGGGLGGARSSLAALADTQVIKSQTAALVSAVGKVVDGLPASDLTAAEVERAVTAALVKAGLTH